MSQPASAPVIEPDSYVVNPRMREWGPGRVMQLEGAKAIVCFRDAASEAAGDGLKTMVLRSLEASPVQSDPWLDNLPPFKHGKFQVTQPRVTFDEGAAELVRLFAQGFADPTYVEAERRARCEASALWTETLGQGRAEALLSDGDTRELATRALATVKLSGLLNRTELAALRDALADDAGAKGYFAALLPLLSAAPETGDTLASYFEAVGELSLRAKTAAAKWTISTCLPFLARPDALLVLKPDVSKPAAERLRFDLGYQVEPNARSFEKLQRMSDALFERLAPLGASDRIDVHAFLGFVSRYGSSRARA